MWGLWIVQCCSSLGGLMTPGSEVIHSQTLVLLHVLSLDLFPNANNADLITHNYINRTHKQSTSLSTCISTYMDACRTEVTYTSQNNCISSMFTVGWFNWTSVLLINMHWYWWFLINSFLSHAIVQYNPVPFFILYNYLTLSVFVPRCMSILRAM